MTQPNDGEPAFPVPMVRYEDNFFNVTDAGMSLRDWFAGQALSGLCSGSFPFCPDQVSATAYAYADAMIRAREARHGN